MLKKYWTFNHFTLLVALSISVIAAWYSVLGLTAIFAGAVIPIIIMGSVLEVAKITTTVWLHRHWAMASRVMRLYLVTAVIALACLTSMGIFGLLSKAHLDQGLVGGDVLNQIALFDEKIKIQRDNIEASRRALQQMDAQVDARLQRGDSETGAERAVQIRRQQGAERARLLKEVGDAQKEITKLTDQRAPFASQLRKVEAEVGPIKYIAALVYGDNPDSATLERAVRWVIIMIVAVFDPLAIVLILAANKSIEWQRRASASTDAPLDIVEPPSLTVEAVETPVPPIPVDPPVASEIAATEPDTTPKYNNSNYILDGYKMMQKPAATDAPAPNTVLSEVSKPVVATDPVKEDQAAMAIVPPEETAGVETRPWTAEEIEALDAPAPVQTLIETGGVTEQVYSSDSGYVLYAGKTISTQALKHLKPGIVVSGPLRTKILWGKEFPQYANSGDNYIRVDVTPHRVYIFNGTDWIQIDKTSDSAYLTDESYIKYLIDQIDVGNYDANTLTQIERAEISRYLKQIT